METSKGVWNTLLGPRAPCFSWLCDTSSLPHLLASWSQKSVTVTARSARLSCSASLPWETVSLQLRSEYLYQLAGIPLHGVFPALQCSKPLTLLRSRGRSCGSLPCVTQIAVWVRFCIWGSTHLCQVESRVKRGVRTHWEKTNHQTDCHFQAARKSLIYNWAQRWQEQLKNSSSYREYDSSWTFLHSVLAQPICTTLQSLLQ